MATNIPVKPSVASSRRRLFNRVGTAITGTLVLLFLICLGFAWSTRDAVSLESQTSKQASNESTLVDLHPWQTAQTLAPLALTREEIEYAHDAERLADHEGDQAFASALREAGAQRRALTGPALELSRKVTQLQALVKDDQAHMQTLTQSAASSSNGTSHVTAENDLEVAKAQLGLDSDELTDAEQDLARALGDKRTKIQEELTAHEAAMRKFDAGLRNDGQPTLVAMRKDETVATQFRSWIGQHSRLQSIQHAMQQARQDVGTLTERHNHLEGEATKASTARARAAGPQDSSASGEQLGKDAQIAKLKNGSAQRQLLSIYDDRIQTQQQLAAVYGKWAAQVQLQNRILLHLLLQSLALIVFILLCVIGLDALVRHFVTHSKLDRRRIQTLRTVFLLGIRSVGVLLILLVLFGPPNQMPTIIGLTTAGLTVVMQDFIIAFFGWFILMGKSGIRVGDWVEINGIGGEVVEVGLFRTALLETGNWTDKGHPTGRRITMINSFAIKGQYFNFSTTGQWMWDEIMFSIPAGEDTYRTVELIYKAVLKETEKDAQLAGEEWKRLARHQSMTQFTAAPAVDLRPGAAGIDIVVRYVTRASNRFEVRNRLYQTMIDLLHKPAIPALPAERETPTELGR